MLGVKAFFGLVFYPPQPLVKHGVFVLFCVVLLGLGLLPETVLLHGEFYYGEGFSWRWFCAHFIHLGFAHALMNIAGALTVWLLCVSVLPVRLLLALLLLLPCWISLGMALGGAEAQSYRGFSGAIEGFLVAGALWQWWLSRGFSVVLLAFVVGKLLWEHLPAFDDAYLMDSIGGLVAVDAHFFGALGGFFGCAAYLLCAFFRCKGFTPPWHIQPESSR